MPAHGICELRLAMRTSLLRHEHDRARVEHGRQRREPRLVLVVRPVEAQCRVREQALEEVGTPALPREEERADVVAALAGVASKELARARGRAGARVQL